MPIKVFIDELMKNKVKLLLATIIGFCVLSIVGYMNRNDVNDGVVYCSEANILIDHEENNQYIIEKDKTYQKKNETIVTSDEVLDSVVSILEEKNIPMARDEIRNTIIVSASDDIITITIHHSNKDLVKLICEGCTENAVVQLSRYTDGNAIILNEASEPFSAVIDVVDSTSHPGEKISTITPKEITAISSKYIVKEMIKYGVLGALIFLCIAIFIYSVKILFKKEA